jgi:hypothetical protein
MEEGGDAIPGCVAAGRGLEDEVCGENGRNERAKHAYW